MLKIKINLIDIYYHVKSLHSVSKFDRNAKHDIFIRMI